MVIEQRFPRIIGLFCVFIGAVVLLGWMNNIDMFLTLLPGAASMKFNTAFLFLLAGLSCFLKFGAQLKLRYLEYLLSLFICFVGFITFIQYPLKINFGIDNLVINDLLSQEFPGRMSPATSICFFFLGLSDMLQAGKRRTLHLTAQYLLHTITVISLVSIISYLLAIPSTDKIFFLNSMALHTSILFLLISAAQSFTHGDLGITGLLRGAFLGSRLFRNVIPYIVVVPVLISFLLFFLINHQFTSLGFGIVICCVIIIIIGIIYLTFIAKKINEADKISHNLKTSLQQSNDELSKFKSALDASTIVAITDHQGVINYVNDKFCEISKFSRQELIGNTHAIINSGYHPLGFFKKLWQTISSGEIWSGEIKNKAKDGTYYWVQTAIVPFVDNNGRPYQYLAIRQDITDKKVAEELIASHYVQELERKNKELEHFTYIVSHDLQEPLRTVDSFVEILKEDFGELLGEAGITHLNFMSKATGRMRLLIKEILDYSRIGSSRRTEKIDCNLLVENVLQDLQDQVNSTNADVFFENLPIIEGYEIELRSLFQNLLSNALKFQAPGQKARIEIKSYDRPNHWEFSVSDNGIGMDSKDLEKIFTIFERLHNLTEYPGTGIGLARCKKIVELHGGNINVSSKKGIGSTFSFTLNKQLSNII